MGTAKAFAEEKLVVGVLISRPRLKDGLLQALQETFGPVDFTSGELDFTWTSYYDREMGLPIRRFFLAFERLVAPESLAGIKLQTNAIEDAFREGGGRRVNLDPGLLSLSRFILASTKDGSHRVPLREGVYAEITLVFERGGFRPLEWTYPDYRSPEYAAVLNEVRRRYAATVRSPAARRPPPG